ncbi:MAG: translesion error-prone DNA polymerase V autoproteolytic subunit [Planctomycetaceae bacterium]|jgi:DNA polymerase V|nr:translesion error-prone DNA polymerase V autoproteolytic subunit [Planctomycetaceae bacterium]
MSIESDSDKSLLLFACGKIQAGFPTPVDGGVSAIGFDLMRLLAPNPPATFIIRVSGNSMINAGIFDGDLLIVDRSLQPENNNIVVATIDEEFTVKRLIIKNKNYELHPENPDFKPIKFANESELKIWGVVKKVIHFV